ncbi:hypothetical protein D3C80_1786070 [compost metagenome]
MDLHRLFQTSNVNLMSSHIRHQFLVVVSCGLNQHYCICDTVDLFENILDFT